MEQDLQRVVRCYAGFLVVFCVTVLTLWLFGAELFSILLQKSRAYTPPQFLTWLSLASSLSIITAFCLMPFSLFRMFGTGLMFPSDGWCYASPVSCFYLGLARFSGC